MANSFVIVALPCEDDYVNQVSSDKVPHMTLVFMGDSSNVDSDQYEHIVGFVEHAASLINPFYMDVDYRGTLGPDNADVLFFEKGWDFKMVCQFRDNLMSDPEIKKAELSVPNPYAQFTPHLTLGYPTSPAKKPDHEHPFWSVRFDRIAVWLDNFDGPEFRLMRDPLYAGQDSPYVSMSALEAKTLLQVNVSDILSHHGIKGQKWGVRKARDGVSAVKGLRSFKKDVHREQAAVVKSGAKKAGKVALKGLKATGRGLGAVLTVSADLSWAEHATSSESTIAVHNHVADKMNGPDGAIAKLNNSPKYRGKNLLTDKQLEIEYHQDFNKVSDALHRTAVKDILGSNFSDTKEAHYVNDVSGARIEIRDKATGKIAHADATFVDFYIPLTLDSKGFITSAKTTKSMAQAEDLINDILSHHGIKGQKWGVRRTHPSASGGGDRALNPTPSSRLKAQVQKIKDKHDKSLGDPTPVVAKPVVSKKTGKAGIATTGGERQPAHPDAVTAAAASAQLHTSGIKSLSNKELQDLATRLNLEQNVNRLDPPKLSTGKRIIDNILNNPNKVANDLQAHNKLIGEGEKLFKAVKKISTAGAL